MELRDRRALVCGASQGIGRAIALELAQRGATVWLLARSSEKLEKVERSLFREAAQEHRSFTLDLGVPSAAARVLRQEVREHGPIHILVNNSGGPAAGPLLDADPGRFRQDIVAHVEAAHTLTRLFLPGMTDSGYGRIVNIVSTSVKQPLKGLGVSNTIRGAMASWAKTMATELAPMGVTVNNVLPGATRTERLASLIRNRAKRDRCSQADVEKAMLAEIPAGRFGEPEEIARAVAFLASPGAAYVTGINLPVDGGRTSCL